MKWKMGVEMETVTQVQVKDWDIIETLVFSFLSVLFLG